MGKADSLSRRPDWEIGVEKDNEDETLIKPEWLKVRRAEIVEIIVDGVDLLKEVRKSKVKDDEVLKAVEEMKRAGVKMLRDEEWREVDGIMYKEGKVYIPRVSQTSFGHISINSPSILTVSMATESP